jgi:DNA-binding YbaB/EbfC family protein
MQQDLMRMQEEMDNKTYTASAGGGMVKAEVTGKNQIVSLQINPEAVDPDDVEMLQDLVIAAVNEAMRAAAEDQANQMSRMTGGLNLGGFF